MYNQENHFIYMYDSIATPKHFDVTFELPTFFENTFSYHGFNDQDHLKYA